MTPRSSPLRPVLAVVLVLLALVAAACGVPEDSQPRDIPTDDTENLEPRDPAPEQTPGPGPKVYFLSDDDQAGVQLVSATRDVAPTPSNVLGELFAGLTIDERARRWRTAIPSDTVLNRAFLDAEGTVVVDLSSEFFQAEGDEQVFAVAQIVFTLSELDGVQQVRILVDGQSREWPRGDGTLQAEPLTTFAYPDLNPTSQPDYPPQPSPTTPTSSTMPTSSGIPTSSIPG